MARRRNTSVDDDAPKVKVTKESFKDSLKIFKYIKPYRIAFIFGMIMLFLSSVVFMIFPYLAGQMIDIAQGKASHQFSLADIGWGLLAMLILQGLVAFFRVLAFATVSEKAIADVRNDVYAKLISLPISFFDNNRVGDLVSRLTADVEKLYNTFSITLAEFLRQIITLIVGVGFLAFTAWKLSLIMLATFPLIVIGAIFFGRFIRKLSKSRQKALADTNTIVNETVQSIQDVKSYTNEWYEANRYSNSIKKVVVIALKYAKGRAGFATFMVSVLFGAIFFIIWQGAMLVASNEMTAGELISFVFYTGIIGGSIAGLGNFYSDLVGTIGATERIREILGMESEVDVKPIENFTPAKGHIAYEDVRFSYPTRPDIEVLKGISLEIKAGQKVALVGSSGAGKSTIVQLLLRLYQIEKGTITLDGKSISDYEISDYRNNFAMVPQEVLLFGGSIRENILYGKPTATEEEIIQAAKQSNSYEFINSFPEGFDTMVGERGVKLSGGQRQRIAIARAILRNPSILLLDEATSSLDAESERVVQDALDNLMENRTSIIIAHRLATIKNVDKIYVINDGMIVEQGTHDELVQKEDGIYQQLARLQFNA